MNWRSKLNKTVTYTGKSIFLMAMFIIGALFTLASTGGDGNDGSGDRNLPPATLTADGADEVAGAALQVSDLAGPISTFGATDDIILPASASGDTDTLLGNLIGEMHALARLAQPGSEIGLQAVNDDCDTGTKTISDLDVNIQDLSIVYEITVTYTNCVIGTKTFDGSEKIKFETPLAGQNVFQNFEFSTQSYSYQNSASGDDLTMTAFSMFVDELELNLTELEDVTVRLSGQVTGTAAGEAVNVEYDNFSIAMHPVTDGDEYTLSGNFKGQCMDGWASVSTETPIFVPTGGGCPTEGGVSVSSAGITITVEVVNDDDISVAFDGEVPTVYDSCDDITGICS